MDIQLIRTFLEVITAGSFNEAAERVNVTQSAVSLRVKRLEESLGQPLFLRSKAGIELTPAGEQFERFARSLLKIWEESKYQIALPTGYTELLSIACQYTLWPKLGGRWLRRLERDEKECAFRAELGNTDRLMRMMIQGISDIGLMHTPQLRPGLKIEELLREDLILVSATPDYPASLDSRYVFMDWAPEFSAAHAIHFSDLEVPRINLSLGPLALNFIVEEKRAAYFPSRLVRKHINDGLVHVVPEAPVFPFPVYVIWNSERNPPLMERALASLRTIAETVETEQEDILDEAEIDGNAMRKSL